MSSSLLDTFQTDWITGRSYIQAVGKNLTLALTKRAVLDRWAFFSGESDWENQERKKLCEAQKRQD